MDVWRSSSYSFLPTVNLCIACGRDIPSVKIYQNFYFSEHQQFSSLSLRSSKDLEGCCFQSPRTWRAAAAAMSHHVISFQIMVSMPTQWQWWQLTLTLTAAGGGRDDEDSQLGWDLFFMEILVSVGEMSRAKDPVNKKTCQLWRGTEYNKSSCKYKKICQCWRAATYVPKFLCTTLCTSMCITMYYNVIKCKKCEKMYLQCTTMY